MNAEEVRDLLRELTIPGASVRPAEGKPGSGLEHGFIVTGQHGARMAWQVALQANGAQADASSVSFPDAVPAEPDCLTSVDVEASIAAWIGQSEAAECVTDLERYSTENRASGIQYGLRLTLDSGGRVFIQLIWTLHPGEKRGPENKYILHATV